MSNFHWKTNMTGWVQTTMNESMYFPSKIGDFPAIARWWFQTFLEFSPLLGEMIQFDKHIFQMGWFHHQLDCHVDFPCGVSNNLLKL